MPIKLKVTATNKTDFKKARNALKVKTFRSLEHLAATVRLSALSSIRTGTVSKKTGERLPSKPGSTPRTWAPNKWLKQGRNILYGKTETGYSVFVNPKFSGNRVLQMLEAGGTQTIRVADPGGGKKRRRIRLGPITKQEREHIREYYHNLGSKGRDVRTKTVTARYQSRSFLGPALAKNLHKIPSVWRVSTATN